MQFLKSIRSLFRNRFLAFRMKASTGTPSKTPVAHPPVIREPGEEKRRLLPRFVPRRPASGARPDAGKPSADARRGRASNKDGKAAASHRTTYPLHTAAAKSPQRSGYPERKLPHPLPNGKIKAVHPMVRSGSSTAVASRSGSRYSLAEIGGTARPSALKSKTSKGQKMLATDAHISVIPDELSIQPLTLSNPLKAQYATGTVLTPDVRTLPIQPVKPPLIRRLNDRIKDLTTSSTKRSPPPSPPDQPSLRQVYGALSIRELAGMKCRAEIKLDNVISASDAPETAGIANIGNTCFMAAALQCLYSTPPLVDYMRSKRFQELLKLRGKDCRLATLFSEMYFSVTLSGRSLRPCSPWAFKAEVDKRNPWFEGFEQHDSQEFLSFVLDSIQEDLSRVAKRPTFVETTETAYNKEFDSLSPSEKALCMWNRNYVWNNSILSDLFCGQFESETICGRCGTVSAQYDPFWLVSLPVPKEGDHKLDTLVKSFLKEGDELPDFKCSGCRLAGCVARHYRFHRLPPVLIIHLKRFDKSGSAIKKLDTAVDIPRLGFSPPSNDQSADHAVAYELYATINHYGTFEFGHYTAFCRQAGRWLQKNDATSSPTDPPDDFRHPYVLFYRRTR